MLRTKHVYRLAIIMLTAFLTACGGGGGSNDASDTALTSVTSGVAVDPYIVNAYFEEISADGKLLQTSLAPSDDQGHFTFRDPIAEGSIIRLKASANVLHVGAFYEGILKRQVSIVDGSAVVVSPLTTLVANGMSEDEVITMMAAAGLPGLTAEDLYADPVAGLEGLTNGVSEEMLRNLQANMAVNSYMEATGNFNYNGATSGANLMSVMVGAVQQTLNADRFNELAADVRGFILGDLIDAAVQVNSTIASQIGEALGSGGQEIPNSQVDQIVGNATADANTIAMGITQNRNGGPVTPPTTDPVTPPIADPGTPATGEELYVADCQNCHGNLQTTRISNRTAAGIQAAIDGDAGGMGNILLTAEQIQLIADALPAPEPPPVQPPQYRNGQAVYDQECSGCHKLATHDSAGNIDLAGKGSVIVPKIEGGHMAKNLPAQELNALADFADTFSAPVPPVVPRSSQAVYDENCSGCHKLNGYDAVGNVDLAGMGSVAAAKVPTGHGGSISTEELTTLAAWLDSWAPVPPPVVARYGQAVYDENCSGCHKLYGYDAAGNLDLASMGSTATTKLATGHGGTVSSEEVTNLTGWLDSWIPAPPPVVDRNGETIYNENCTVCHKLYNYDAADNIDLASKGALVPAKLGTGHGGAVTAGEVTNIASWLNTWSPEPPPVVARSGETVYTEICAACHKLNGYDATGNIDLASMGNTAIGKLATGHGGTVSDVEVINLADWLDTWAPIPPPVVDRTGQVVYDGICAGCHKLNGYDTTGNIDLASKGSTATTKLATGHGGTVSAGEITNVAIWLDSWAPVPPPVVDRTGQVVYDSTCAGCHKLYGYDAVGNIDLASKGSTATTKLATGHGGTVSAGEITNVANWLDSWAPAPPPVVDRTGQAVYDDNCAVCHKLYNYDAAGNIDLASMGTTAVTKLGTGHGGTVSTGEVTNVANWLDTWSPAPPPVVTRNGETVYNDNCSGCHKVNTYDAVGNIDLAGQGDLVPTKLGTGHGGTVSADEQTNLISWLNTFQASDPYAGACDTCHGQPPSGSNSPNVAGAHAVHTTLASVANECATCHTGAAHNAQVDLGFATTWNAKSGAATGNSNGTCSNISCHGGVTTPVWGSGLINVDTQCSSCHTYGTSQYNGYSSGEHNKHVRDKNYACSACHDAAKLQNGHFTNLSTRAFEQAPSATIKSSLSYSGGRCATPSCHSGKSW